MFVIITIIIIAIIIIIIINLLICLVLFSEWTKKIITNRKRGPPSHSPKKKFSLYVKRRYVSANSQKITPFLEGLFIYFQKKEYSNYLERCQKLFNQNYILRSFYIFQNITLLKNNVPLLYLSRFLAIIPTAGNALLPISPRGKYYALICRMFRNPPVDLRSEFAEVNRGFGQDEAVKEIAEAQSFAVEELGALGAWVADLAEKVDRLSSHENRVVVNVTGHEARAKDEATSPNGPAGRPRVVDPLLTPPSGSQEEILVDEEASPPTNGLALIGVPVGESANEELTEVDVMIDSSQGKEVPHDVRGVLVAEQAVVKSVSDSDLEAVARQGQPFFVHSESASQLPDLIGSSHFVLGASPATVSLRSGVQQSHILTTERSIANVGPKEHGTPDAKAQRHTAQ
eukprot:gene1712-1063_t